MGTVPCTLLVLLLGAPGPDAQPAPDAPVRSFLLLQGLDRIGQHDPQGLGEQARAAFAWARPRTPVRLEPGPPAALTGTGEAVHVVSPELAVALRRLSDYQALSLAARAAPPTTEELRAELLEPAALARVQELFERTLREGIVLDDERLFPELGGEALLDDGLQLRTFEDPTRLALAEIAAARAEPDRVAAILARAGETGELLDPHGQLEREVALWRQRTERGVSEERRRRAWDMATETVLRGGADSFVLHPAQQLEAIVAQEWSGRYVGLWHLHPPGWSPAGLRPADAPSPDDRVVARTTGRFVTLVFRPDGFDAYDVRASGPEAPRIEHRSEPWRRRFAALHAALAGR